jgi:shikimate kinase
MVSAVAHLVMITGPMASGKNTVAEHLARTFAARGHTVVIADVDDVADMVRNPGAGLERFAAHEAHGALVGQWMRSAVDVVISVGPVYSDEEQAAFTRTLPDVAAVRWVVVDAPVAVTLARAQANPNRGRSRDPEFHHRAHGRFRELVAAIPAEMTFDSSVLSAEKIAVAIADRVAPGRQATARRSNAESPTPGSELPTMPR